MPAPQLDALRRAFEAALLEIEDARRRGDTPPKEQYVDSTLALIEALVAHDLPREALEVVMRAGREGPSSAGLVDELTHRRAELGLALGDAAVVRSALRTLERQLARLRGREKRSAEQEIVRLTRALEDLPAASPAVTPPLCYVHPTLGEGVRTGGDERTVRLRFADGSERTFLRSKLTER